MIELIAGFCDEEDCIVTIFGTVDHVTYKIEVVVVYTAQIIKTWCIAQGVG